MPVTRWLWITGWIAIVLGALTLVGWAWEPLRQLARLLLALPLAVRAAAALGVLGFAFLLGSVIADRIEQRRNEGDLLDDGGDHRG